MKIIKTPKALIKEALIKEKGQNLSVCKVAGLWDSIKDKATDIHDQWMIGKQLAKDYKNIRPSWERKYDSLRDDPRRSNVQQIPGYQYVPGLYETLYSSKHPSLINYNPFRPYGRHNGKLQSTNKAKQNPNTMNTISSYLKSLESTPSSAATAEEIERIKQLVNQGFIIYIEENNEQGNQTNQNTQSQLNAVPSGTVPVQNAF